MAAGLESPTASGTGGRVRGLLVAGYGVAATGVCILVQTPVMALTGSGDFSIWLAQHLWSPSALWLSGVKVRIAIPRALPDGPVVFACNHESALDVWALCRVLDRNFRFVAKRELFRIPLLGWYLRKARFIEVDRRDHQQAVGSLQRGGAIIRGGTSIVVFPEGTRSPHGRIQPFKRGPFVLALEAGVPVVPVAIAGAAALNPKGTLRVLPGEIRVGIGEPVDPRLLPDRNQLLREVRRRIIALHRAMGGLGGDEEDAIASPGMEGVSGTSG